MERKPPLGIMPKHIWIEKRIQDLKDAIYRYLEADFPVPYEWYRELEKHIRERFNT